MSLLALVKISGILHNKSGFLPRHLAPHSPSEPVLLCRVALPSPPVCGR